MEKPYFLITSTSGKSAVLIDRRTEIDEQSQAMRERLINTGCTQQEITEQERDALLEKEKGQWLL